MAVPKKKQRASSAPEWLPGKPTSMMIWIPEDLHKRLKRVAKEDRRSMSGFVVTAVEERVARFEEQDIDSANFVPPGLRR